MKRQRQQHSQHRRSSLASTPLFIVAALTIPTLLRAFAPNAVVHSKRSMQHQSAQDLQIVQHHTQAAQSPPLISTPLSFLVRTSATTSKSKLFARGPGRPSAASLEEHEDDGDLDFEDDADEVEGKRRSV